MASFFGGKSKEEHRREAAKKADKQIQAAVCRQIDEVAKSYVQAAASAVLASAENGLSHVYIGRDFRSLQKDISLLDKDIQILSRIWAKSSNTLPDENATQDHNHSYENLYRLWSPVENTRQSVINMFVHWFGQQEQQFQAEAIKWIDIALTTNSDIAANSDIKLKINTVEDFIAFCCNVYLRETDQRLIIRKDVLVRDISSVRHPELSLKWLYSGYRNWSEQVGGVIEQQCLFDDTENFLLGVFYPSHRKGIVGAHAGCATTRLAGLCSNS